MKQLLFFVTGMGLLAQAAVGDTQVRIGIFGVVDQPSPLVVAGQAVFVPKNLPVLSALGDARAIAKGDTLAIRATFQGGTLKAERILEVYAVAGPVTARDGTEATVLGTLVHIPIGSDPKIGDWVAVSGLWSGEKVITTALHQSDVGGLAQLSGVFDLPDAADPPRLGGTPIIGAAVPEEQFEAGIWTLTGVPEGAGLRVRTLARGVFGGAVDLQVREGYASGPVASETWMVHGSEIYGYDREADMPPTGARVRVCAADGKVIRAAGSGASPEWIAAMALLNCG